MGGMGYLPPQSLLALLSMTKPRWAPRARVVAIVGAFDGDWLSSRHLARYLGRSHAAVNELVRVLVEDRVLLREIGGGSAGYWLQVNPDVLAWDNVPWTVDADAMLALFEKRLANFPSPVERFLSCSYGRTKSEFLSGALGTTDDELAEALRAVKEAGHNGSLRAEAAAERTAKKPDSRSNGRTAKGPDTNRRISSSNSSRRDGEPEALPIDAIGGPEGADGGDIAVEVWERIEAAVLTYAAPKPGIGKFIRGAPEASLRRLIARHGEDAILEALPRCDRGLWVPSLIPELRSKLEFPDVVPVHWGATPEIALAPQPLTRAELEARLASARSQLRVYEAADAGEVEIENLRATVAACEDELRAFDEGER